MLVFYALANVLVLAGDMVASAHGEPTTEGTLNGRIVLQRTFGLRESLVTEVVTFSLFKSIRANQ